MKKLISLLLVIVMLLCTVALTACNKTPAEDTNAPEDTKAPAKETTEAPEETTEAPQELTTITILCKSMNNNMNQWYRYDNNERWAQIPLVQQFYDKLAEVGIHLEFELVDDEQYNEAVKTRLLTGVNLPDIIVDPGLSDTEVANAGEAGILADVNALLDQYDEDGSAKAFMAKVGGAWLAKHTDEQGRMFSYPYVYLSQYVDDNGEVMEDVWFSTGYAVSIREDWLNAIGREWKMFMTPDEFADNLIALYENDANGNGVKDEVIGNLDCTFYTGFESAFGMGRSLINVRNDGKGIQCNLYSEGLGDYVAFLNKLYNAGVIDTTVLNGTDVKGANRASCLHDYMGQTWHEAAIVGYEDTAVYSPVILDDDEGENGYALSKVDGAQNLYGRTFVNAGSENLEAVAKFLDVFYSDETSEMINYGIEGVHYFVNEKGQKLKASSFPADAKEAGLSIYDEATNPDPNLLTLRVWTSTGHVNIEYATSPIALGHPSESQNPLFQHKHDVCYYNLLTADKIISQESNALACPTAEELEIKASVEGDINTYVSELMLALIIGEKTMDDVPAALEELEGMGLKELIGVYEAQHQRFLDVCEDLNIDSIYN